MPRKRYIFPYVKKGTPFYHYAVSAKSLLERLDEVYASFERLSDTSNSRSPQYLLYMALQHNESLLELGQYTMNPDPDTTSPKAKSRKSLKRKRLSIDESEKSKSLDAESSQQTASDSPPKTKSRSLDAESSQQTVSDSPPETKKISLDTESSSSQKTVSETKSRSFDTESSSSQQTISDSPSKTFSSTISNIGSTLRILAAFVPTSDGQTPSSSGVKQKCSSDDESQKSGSLDSKKDSSTFPELKDLFPSFELQTLEPQSAGTSNFNTITELVKDYFKDNKHITDAQKNVTSGDSTEMTKKADSENPAELFNVPALSIRDEKDTSTSKSTDLDPTSQESTIMETSNLTMSVEELSSPIKKPKENVSPCVKELDGTSDKVEMPKKTDAVSPFKIPKIPLKYRKEGSNEAKRQIESSPTRQFLSPSKKSKTGEMDISPKKSPTPKRPTSLSPRQEFASPSKKGEKISSPRKVKFGSILQDRIDAIYRSPIKDDESDMLPQTPPIKDYGIEIDMPSPSDEKPGPSHRLTEAEMEKLFDDPSRVQSIKEVVQKRIMVRIPLKKIKLDTISSDQKSPRRSPRKPKKIGSPGNIVGPIALPDLGKVSQSILSHPYVISYLKMRFKSILRNRKRYLKKMSKYFYQFYSDVDFLCFYSFTLFQLARDIPVEGQEYFNRDVANSKRRLVRDAKRLKQHLNPISNASNMDKQFWTSNLIHLKSLNKQNKHLLSAPTSTKTAIELLREYESQLRVIWNMMDNKVLEADAMKLSMVEISEDFKQLIRDFSKYLQMIKFMKPSSLASEEENRTRLSESFH